jgi:hypothetical protein
LPKTRIENDEQLEAIQTLIDLSVQQENEAIVRQMKKLFQNSSATTPNTKNSINDFSSTHFRSPNGP